MEINETHELYVKARKHTPKAHITSSRNVFEALIQYIELKGIDLNLQEHFFAMYLNRANNLIGIRLITTGTLHSSVVDYKLIYTIGLAIRASNVIVAHNHPSGNLRPSDADIQTTKKLQMMGEVLDTALLDHVIFDDENYYSFADEGMI